MVRNKPGRRAGKPPAIAFQTIHLLVGGFVVPFHVKDDNEVTSPSLEEVKQLCKIGRSVSVGEHQRTCHTDSPSGSFG